MQLRAEFGLYFLSTTVCVLKLEKVRARNIHSEHFEMP